MTDLSLSLKCGRTEILRALGADNAAEERAHRELADELMREAVRELATDTPRLQDWSILSAS